MAIENRYDFVMLFDVENGNPNGDPDAGNSPRMDAETGHGYITDVCLKRKIRNYVELCKEGEIGYNILIKPDKAFAKEQGAKIDEEKARAFMCENYFDVRAFGAVMATGDNPCGIVSGPVQINFARSLSPINIQDVTITRQARTTEDRAETGNTEMGRKSVIPYALYRGEGYISAALAQKVTGLSDGDVELLWTAIVNMFENDHSAARGKMCMRKLYVFKHDSLLGNSPSHVLFDKIQVSLKDETMPPRKFTDYEITVDSKMPDGVTLISKI